MKSLQSRRGSSSDIQLSYFQLQNHGSGSHKDVTSLGASLEVNDDSEQDSFLLYGVKRVHKVL